MRRLLSLAGATVLVAAAASGASAAVLDVRASYTNDTDRPVRLDIGARGGDDVRTLAPGETAEDVTRGSRTLKAWFRECMRVELENPLVGWPTVQFGAFGETTFSHRLSEGETRQWATGDWFAADRDMRSNVVWVKRRQDSDDFKELSVVLRSCRPSENAEKLIRA